MPKRTDRRKPSVLKSADRKKQHKPTAEKSPAPPAKRRKPGSGGAGKKPAKKEQQTAPQRPAKSPAKVGRPTLYTEAVAGSILDKTRAGWPLPRILDAEGMPAKATLYLWLAANGEFMDRYSKAREAGTHALADEILAIADDSRNDWMEEVNAKGEAVKKIDTEVLARSQIRITARLKLMGKFNPKHYGEKVAVEHSGEVRQPMTLAEFEQRVAQAEA